MAYNRKISVERELIPTKFISTFSELVQGAHVVTSSFETIRTLYNMKFQWHPTHKSQLSLFTCRATNTCWATNKYKICWNSSKTTVLVSMWIVTSHSQLSSFIFSPCRQVNLLEVSYPRKRRLTFHHCCQLLIYFTMSFTGLFTRDLPNANSDNCNLYHRQSSHILILDL